MASYEIRGSSIRGVVRVPKTIDHRGKLTATFDNTQDGMRAFEAWAEKLERKKSSGAMPADISGVTCGEMWEAYEEVAKYADTGRVNVMRLRSFQRDPLSKKPLSQVITHDIDEWIRRRLAVTSERTGKSVKPSTVAREINLMSGAFNWAVKTRKWIKVNPCHGAIPLPKSAGRRPVALTTEQIDMACAAAGLAQDADLRTVAARTVVAWMISLETGMRSGEVLRVRPEHYWRERHTVHVAAQERGGRKGSKSGTKDASRNVPLTGRAIELFDMLLRTMPQGQEDEPTRSRLAEFGMLSPPYIVGLTDRQRDANWRIVAKRAGLDGFTYHDSKHEACTRLAKFLDVLDLSHAVGTKDIKLLRDTYYIADASRAAHLLPSRLVG